MVLNSLQFDVRYRPAKTQENVDALSRRPDHKRSTCAAVASAHTFPEIVRTTTTDEKEGDVAIAIKNGERLTAAQKDGKRYGPVYVCLLNRKLPADSRFADTVLKEAHVYAVEETKRMVMKAWAREGLTADWQTTFSGTECRRMRHSTSPPARSASD